MEILFLIDNLGSGGAQRQIVTLSKLLSEKGYKIKFITYNEGDFFRSDIDDLNILVSNLCGKNPLIRIYRVRKALRSGSQDLVISFLETPNFLACISSIGGRRWKLITNERSGKPQSFVGFKNRVFKWFERYSDRIVTNSFAAADLWKNKYPRYSNKIKTIYNPILINEDSSNYVVRSNGKLKIIVVASYQENKNIISLIEAVRSMCNVDRDKFLVEWYGRIEATTGNSSVYERACELINKYDINNIKLNSETKSIINIMKKADIVSLISKIEGLPNVICEGMLLGKPIIMSKVSDYNILVDSSNGILCNPNDINSIKEAFIQATKLSEAEIICMGKKSQEKARKLFNNEIIINQWIETIQSIK